MPSPFKVTLAFALGIILPSGFLTYIGLRSYQYEARIMQSETEERYAAVADLIEHKTSERFSDLLAALRKVAQQQDLQGFAKVPQLNMLNVENVFIFNEADQMVFPWHAGVPTPLPHSAFREVNWGPLADEIERLEQLEFVQHDFNGALQGYTALQAKTHVASLQAALLKNIAGDYRKLGQHRAAAATYLKLARNYDQLPDFSGYPTGFLSRQLAIDLYEKGHAWEEALDVRFELYEGLLSDRWAGTATERKTLLSALQTTIERTLATHTGQIRDQQTRWGRLRHLQETSEKLADTGERFAKNDWPLLLQRMRRQGRLDQGGVFQFKTLQANRLAVIAPLTTPGSDHRRGFWVALLPLSTVWPMLNSTVDEFARPAGVQVVWNDLPSDIRAPQRRWTPRLRREVRAIDPPLGFTLTELHSAVREERFHRRQWISGGMIGFSFIIIVVGLLFMIQAVQREMEVANLKADFVATVSHELRTPLATISHIGDRLNGGRYRSDEERKEIYSILGQETGRLRQLIEDILDFSKMLAGKKVYRHVSLNLAEVAGASIKRFQPKANAQGFKLTTDIPSAPIPILGDSMALTQAILNLLDNALKYSGSSTQIELQVTHTGQNGIISVQDHGIGIAPANKEKIFEKFYRIEHDGPGQEAEGVGLGLAMVKHVVEGHHGKIQVDTQIGQGSRFLLIFPLAKGGSHGSHSGH